ncbi:MAG: clan AA aspartic protease [Calothrix sp. SM1_7_51]|nr:clan AA aspartic protease [Calothrix sp. SM1_7_51]
MLNSNRSRHMMSENTAEIKVQVKLTNEIDQELVYRGYLNPDQVHFLETEALVDPTYVSTVIPTKIAEKLGLDIRRYEIVRDADGREEKVGRSDPIIIEVQGRETRGGALVTGGDNVILGLIALETLDFVVDYENRRLIPNPKHPDYPIFRI